MAQDGFKRKPTGILIANIIGYNRLTINYEDETVYDLTIPLLLIVVIIQQHNGRVLHSPDDTILANVGCVVNAVK